MCEEIKSDTATWYGHTMIAAFMPVENYGYIEELEGSGIWDAMRKRTSMSIEFQQARNFLVIPPKMSDSWSILRYTIKQHSRNLNYFNTPYLA